MRRELTLGDLLQHGNKVPAGLGKRENKVHSGDIKYKVNLSKSHLTPHRRVTTSFSSAPREFLAALCVLFFFLIFFCQVVLGLLLFFPE